jgi:preprotein translocase subunit SecG
MYSLLLIVHVVVALLLIGFILLQQGKGAQAGAAFGSGASQTVFGSQGSGGFLSRATAGLAAVFFVLNILLAYLVNKSDFEEHPAKHSPKQTQAPADTKKSEGEGDIPEVQ